MGQSSSHATSSKVSSGELYLPYDVLWMLLSYIDGDQKYQTLRNVSLLNSNINDITNARLWRSFTIDYDYDYISASDRRRDIVARCQAITRNLARARNIRYLVIQWDAPLGSSLHCRSRSTINRICETMLVLPKLEALKIHCCAHHGEMGHALSKYSKRFPFQLKSLTTALLPQHGIKDFLLRQSSIAFFEGNRHERLKGAQMVRERPDFDSSIMPNLRVIYTSGHRAARLLSNRSLHTVEITNISSSSTFNTPGHTPEEPMARVEHLVVNFDMFPEQLPSFIRYWGIIASSIRYLHVHGAFPTISLLGTILGPLTSLIGLEWSAARRCEKFPRHAGIVSPTKDFIQQAVKECSEQCPTLATITLVSWSKKRDVWKLSSPPKRWQRADADDGHSLGTKPTIQDGYGKRWQLVSSEESSTSLTTQALLLHHLLFPPLLGS